MINNNNNNNSNKKSGISGGQGPGGKGAWSQASCTWFGSNDPQERTGSHRLSSDFWAVPCLCMHTDNNNKLNIEVNKKGWDMVRHFSTSCRKHRSVSSTHTAAHICNSKVQGNLTTTSCLMGSILIWRQTCRQMPIFMRKYTLRRVWWQKQFIWKTLLLSSHASTPAPPAASAARACAQLKYSSPYWLHLRWNKVLSSLWVWIPTLPKYMVITTHVCAIIYL